MTEKDEAVGLGAPPRPQDPSHPQGYPARISAGFPAPEGFKREPAINAALTTLGTATTTAAAGGVIGATAGGPFGALVGAVVGAAAGVLVNRVPERGPDAMVRSDGAQYITVRTDP